MKNNLATLPNASLTRQPLFWGALEAQRATLGPKHPDTLRSAHNLADLLVKTGNVAEAEALFREALAGFSSVLGPSHPSTLSSYEFLKSLLQSQGRAADVRALKAQFQKK